MTNPFKPLKHKGKALFFIWKAGEKFQTNIERTLRRTLNICDGSFMNTNTWDRVIGSLVRRGDRGQAEFSSGEGKNRAGESERDREGDNWKVLHGEEVKKVKKNVVMTGVSVQPLG